MQPRRGLGCWMCWGKAQTGCPVLGSFLLPCTLRIQLRSEASTASATPAPGADAIVPSLSIPPGRLSPGLAVRCVLRLSGTFCFLHACRGRCCPELSLPARTVCPRGALGSCVFCLRDVRAAFGEFPLLGDLFWAAFVHQQAAGEHGWAQKKINKNRNSKKLGIDRC